MFEGMFYFYSWMLVCRVVVVSVYRLIFFLLFPQHLYKES